MSSRTFRLVSSLANWKKRIEEHDINVKQVYGRCARAAKVRGPFGLERVLATIKLSELRDERTREAYRRLESRR